jgi:DMSO/TMAO reductase YedYZ molybdopterin-dependent catalytic subunit
MDKDLVPLNRRRFLQWLGGGLLLGGAAVVGLRGCGLQPSQVPLVPGTTPPAETPRSWSWEIRWIGGTPQPDLATWHLTMDGLVKTARALTMDDIRALPATTLHLRMKCVECWSGPAEWTGVAGRDLLAQVEALPEAAYVTLHALDGYTSTLSIADIVAERVLFVYGMDGQDLPVEQGFPLRLIAPSKYGYKCVKAISRLEFGSQHTLGYWEVRGYDNVGTIQPGFDHPLDLGRTARPIAGGEITEY